MSDPVDARLRRLLGGDHLASLRKRLRQRYERAPLDETVEQMRVDELGDEEHAALASLLGRPQRRSKSVLIDVASVDAALQRSGLAASLRDALEKLDGPIHHLAEARLRRDTLWSSVIGRCTDPGLTAVIRTPTGLGLVKRLARQDPAAAAELCLRAEAVLRLLPARGITRSQLAADALGDAHALDNGRTTATLVLAVWRRATSGALLDGSDMLPETADDSNTQLAGSVERVRAIWARAGVLVNELARPALFLNLPAHKAQSHGWPLGEPAYASLRLLVRAQPRWDVAGCTVYVCENPNLVAIAADRWGAECAPLVCTDGMPAAAQRCLLSQLVQGGARLCYHGDFDWPGLRIGNHVMREHGATAWRFGAVDYLEAVRAAPDLRQALEGNAVEAAWDGALTAVMRECGVAIAEEGLAATLLQDLNGR